MFYICKRKQKYHRQKYNILQTKTKISTEMSKKATKKMTFREVYENLPSVITPKMEFVKRMAKLTCRSENAVRQWIAGARVPDQLAQRTIEQELGIPAEALFPVL